jgi:predicted RNA-binding protein with PIN domain
MFFLKLVEEKSQVMVTQTQDTRGSSRQISQSEVSLVYRASSRTAKGYTEKPHWENQKEEEEEEEARGIDKRAV